MAQKIARLKANVVNQIAAGEVVESPAAIVKELVENSLDAGATKIEIAVEGGGQHLIRVCDDGCGMSEEDALLSLERHATSKIRSTEDFQTLKTMGFRGEALAAIAAVSRFEMFTSEGEVGMKIWVDGGNNLRTQSQGRGRGTVISVRSLFYNVPARKKFQKSPPANAAQVTRTVEALALAHPEVSFSLVVNGVRQLSVKAESQEARVEAIFGPVYERIAHRQLQGFLAAPEEAKLQRRGQYVFVNRRHVFSPLLARAVQMGYGTRLADGLYPRFALFLEIDPGEVDVNVHPQKKEVRFGEEGKIFRWVEEAIASAFPTLPTTQEPLAFTPSFSFPEQSVATAPSQFSFSDSSLPLTFPERPLFVRDHFFFLETEKLLLVDLKKATSRILFEAFSEQKGPFQSLLTPVVIRLDDEDLIADLEKMGIECHMIGPKSLAIDTLPAQMEATEFFRFFELWREQKCVARTLNSFCHTSRRSYTTEEGLLIWRQLLQCREKNCDPVGERVWKEIVSIDFERLLKREWA